MSIYEYTNKNPITIRYDYSDNTYHREYLKVVGRKKILASLRPEKFDIMEYRLIFSTENFPSELLNSDDTEISYASLKINLKPYNYDGSSDIDESARIKIYCFNTPVDKNDTNEQLWNKTKNGTVIKDISLLKSEQSLYVTNVEQVVDSLKYGISCVTYDYSGDSGEAVQSSLYTTTLEYFISYKSKYAQPDINIVHPPDASVTEPLTINWKYTQEMNSPQAYVDLSISNYYDETNEYKILDKYPLSQHTYTIPPEKLIKLQYSGEAMRIKLRAYSVQNIASDYDTEYCSLLYPLPINLSPKGSEIVLLSDVIILKWDVAAKIPSTTIESTISNYPTKFDLEYSANGGESWNIIAKNQTIIRDNGMYQYAVAGNTFPLGIIMWRVQAYVNNYTIGKYASEVFIARVQAATSSVECDGKPMPTLSWQSSAQVAYQVRFADYDSGAIYGTATSHTIPYFYADGNYPVQVRTQASNGEWSDWTEVEYVAISNNVQLNQVALDITSTRHAIVATWTDSGVSDNYILYRNGTPIYIGGDKNYTDIAANGKCTYFVRAISGKYYSQSNDYVINAYPQVDCIYDFIAESWIPLKFGLSPRTRTYSKNTNVVYNHYAGRAKPIAFTAGYTTRQMSGNYVFKTRDEALRISDLSGKRVVFKDTRGGIIIGILNDVNINVESKLYPVTFTITEIDYKEAKEYVT